eukprot:3375007-Prymnesium_polylepis.2
MAPRQPYIRFERVSHQIETAKLDVLVTLIAFAVTGPGSAPESSLPRLSPFFRRGDQARSESPYAKTSGQASARVRASVTASLFVARAVRTPCGPSVCNGCHLHAFATEPAGHQEETATRPDACCLMICDGATPPPVNAVSCLPISPVSAERSRYIFPLAGWPLSVSVGRSPSASLGTNGTNTGVSGCVLFSAIGCNTGRSSAAATSIVSVAGAERVPLESRTRKVTEAMAAPEASCAGTYTTAELPSCTSSPSRMAMSPLLAGSQQAINWKS